MDRWTQLQEKLLTLLTRLPADQANRLMSALRNPSNIQNMGLWLSAILAGVVSVGYALAFRYTERAFHWLLASKYSDATFIMTPLLFLLAWYLVRRFAPAAAGSGIPQIMAANEMDYKGEGEVQVNYLLSPKVAVVKVFSSLLCVLGGGAIGREGPTLQVSACIFHFIGRQIRRVVPETSEQTWVVAGAAAGLASAFNTPLGGIVYAIEELGVTHFHRIRTALVSAVIISGIVAQSALGNYLYLGVPALQPIEFSFLPVALLVGVVSGLAGGIFGRLLAVFARERRRIKSFYVLCFVTLFTGLIMAGMFHVSPHAAGTGIETITGFLFHSEHSSPLLIALRFFGTMVSYLCGAAGGIFSPSLAVGATIGAWMTDIFNTQHPNLMVLLGMIGFLTGVVRTPFTAFILVVEMTDRHAAIFPMMVVALIAQWAAHMTDDLSFYEHIKETWLVPKRSEERLASH